MYPIIGTSDWVVKGEFGRWHDWAGALGLTVRAKYDIERMYLVLERARNRMEIEIMKDTDCMCGSGYNVLFTNSDALRISR